MKVWLVLALIVAACGGRSGGTATDRPADPTTPPAPVVTLPPHYAEVEFGLDYNHDTLAIITPTVRFLTNYPEIAWVAHLSEAAGAASLRLVVASVTAGGAESILIDQNMSISNPTFDTFANKVDLATLLGNAPGDYVMRFLRDTKILAEGKFTLVK